jgi:cell division protein FtsN
MLNEITSRRGKSQTFRYLVALICVLLILFVGLAQTLHVHAQEEAANPGCSLCAMAHVNALPAPVVASLAIGESIMPVGPPELLAAPQRFFSFSLYVRPPPVSTPRS